MAKVKRKPKLELKDEVRDIEEIEKGDEVGEVLAYAHPTKKPKIEIVKYLENISSIEDLSDSTLEEYLGVFIAWQNYVGTQLIKTEVVKAVAESQKELCFDVALYNVSGVSNITEKKKLASTDESYLEALKIYNKAKARHKALQNLFNNCDRGFKAVSRVITIREKLIMG